MSHLLNDLEASRIAEGHVGFEWYGGDHDFTQDYPVVDFIKYPIVRNPLPEHPTSDNWMVTQLNADPAFAVSILQSWLLFGTLEAVSRVHFRAVDWLSTKNDVTFIDTRRWLSLGKYWSRWYVSNLSLKERRNTFKETLKRAHEVCEFLTHVVDNPEVLGATRSTLPAAQLDEIVRIGIMLIEMLMHAAPEYLTKDEGFIASGSRLSSGMEKTLNWRLRKNGWCPSTLKKLRHIGGWHTFLEFACLFSSTDQTGDHSRCSETICTAHIVDVEDSKAKHVSSSCQCRSVAPPVEEIMHITLDSTFPLINISVLWRLAQLPADHPSIPKLRAQVVVEYRPTLKFMAISHVWSDGFRGTSDDGLPTCQVNRLHSLSGLVDSQLIWLDVLCIPKDSSTRRSAIAKMYNVYHSAFKTLVVDAGIIQSRLSNTSPREIMLRIITSTWQYRMWTLQESLLSSNLIFMLDDGSVTLKDLYEALQDIQHKDPVTNLMLRETRGMLHYRQNGSQTMPLDRVAPMLNLRSTSHQSDEPLAIASLLGIDTRAVVNEDSKGETRMRAFWRLFAEVPVDLPMVDLPRLTTIGYRALPRTFMGCMPAYPIDTLDENPAGRLTERGLEAEYFIITLPCLQVSPNLDEGVIVNDLVSETSVRFTLFDISTELGSLRFDTLIMLSNPASLRKRSASIMKGAVLQSKDSCELDVVPIYEYVTHVLVFDYTELVNWGNKSSDHIIAEGLQKRIIIT